MSDLVEMLRDYLAASDPTSVVDPSESVSALIERITAQLQRDIEASRASGNLADAERDEKAIANFKTWGDRVVALGHDHDPGAIARLRAMLKAIED